MSHTPWSPERYARRKAAGICTRCDRPAVPGFTHCESCRQQQRNLRADTERQRRVNGLCLQCGEPAGGKSRCEKHRARKLELQTAARMRAPPDLLTAEQVIEHLARGRVVTTEMLEPGAYRALSHARMIQVRDGQVVLRDWPRKLLELCLEDDVQGPRD